MGKDATIGRHAPPPPAAPWPSSAYPVLVVLTFACGMCGGYMAYTGMKNQDVRFSTSKRQQLIRTWE
eukprot:scaffold8284_cov145-Skeletonema_menzelii.AAC.2